MGWERHGGGLYYYRNRWQDGRPVKEYLGNGRTAELAARLDAEEQAEREAQRAAERDRRAQIEAVDELIDALCRGTDLLAAATLVVAGYHQHDRGAWRKRRWRHG